MITSTKFFTHYCNNCILCQKNNIKNNLIIYNTLIYNCGKTAITHYFTLIKKHPCNPSVITPSKVNRFSKFAHQHVSKEILHLTIIKVVGGWPAFSLKFALSDIPSFEHHDFGQYPLIVPQPWELAKSSISTLIGSRPRAFQRAIDEPCTLPLRPPNFQKGGTKRDFAVLPVKSNFCRKVCYKVSLSENLQRRSCSYVIPLSNGP